MEVLPVSQSVVLLTYLLKAGVTLALFYILYRLLMRRETFHSLNRWLLLGMLVASFILPCCVITVHRESPAENKGAIVQGLWSAPPEFLLPEYSASSDRNSPQEDVTMAMSSVETGTVTDLAEQGRDRTADEAQAASNVTAERIADTEDNNAAGVPAMEMIADAGQRVDAVNPASVLLAIWAAGCLFFLFRTLWSVLVVRRLLRSGNTVENRCGVRIVVTDRDVTPFSWMKNIVLGTADYGSDARGTIISHEMAHVGFGHSMDLLVADLLSSAQWFNPTVYLLRRDLQNVHEYQADECVLAGGADVRQYQYMLLGKVASQNGYSVANHFKKFNLSNRIFMMNRKDSKKTHALKALFAPVVVIVMLMAFGVTVYDCAPSQSGKTAVSGAPASLVNIGSGRYKAPERNQFGDSLQLLDERYGAGKFSWYMWGGANLHPHADGNVRVNIFSDEAMSTTDGLAAYLVNYSEERPIFRSTIILSEYEGIGSVRKTGLELIRPTLEQLEANGIRAIVVATDRESEETYYSRYKYGRIYAMDDGTYVFEHNGLEAQCGTADDVCKWITLLDIQYVAFYPDRNMSWEDAAQMMDIALCRGVRTFSVCELMSSMGRQDVLQNLLAEIKGEKDTEAELGNGARSCEAKEKGSYKITVLPTLPESTAAFAGHTLQEVADMLNYDLQESFLKGALKVVEHPESFYNNFANIDKIVFGKDELVMTYHSSCHRLQWHRADTGMEIIADGKRYRQISDEGLPEFNRIPWTAEYGYANGNLCWVPENGLVYGAYHFEAVPADAVEFDVVDGEGSFNYAMKGVKVSDGDHRFDNVEVLNPSGTTQIEVEGTYQPVYISVGRMEAGPDELALTMDILIRSNWSFPCHIGSDLKLIAPDGTEIAPIRVDGAPLDEDFTRGGDYVSTCPIFVFPPVDMDKMKVSYSEYEKTMDAMAYEDVIAGKVSLGYKLTGTICHKPFELPVFVVNRD